MLASLRSLIYRMQEEDARIAEKIDSLTVKLIDNRTHFSSDIESVISSPDDFLEHYRIKIESSKIINERLKLKGLQRKIRDYILIVSRMIEENHISYENFPVFHEIELAERLAESGRIEEEQQHVAVSQ